MKEVRKTITAKDLMDVPLIDLKNYAHDPHRVKEAVMYEYTTTTAGTGTTSIGDIENSQRAYMQEFSIMIPRNLNGEEMSVHTFALRERSFIISEIIKKSNVTLKFIQSKPHYQQERLREIFTHEGPFLNDKILQIVEYGNLLPQYDLNRKEYYVMIAKTDIVMWHSTFEEACNSIINYYEKQYGDR